MIESAPSQDVERRELGGFQVEALSVGKYKNKPELNEDGFAATDHTFAVIDGSAPRTDVKFSGKSSAHFAKDILKTIFTTTPPSLNGVGLVTAITKKLNEEVDAMGMRETITQIPEARPAALFACARINGDKLVVTALGDIVCKVNGKTVHEDHILTEDLMVKKRIAAMNTAYSQNPNLSDDELRTLGRATIDADLKTQVGQYFNNPTDSLGLGIIDGQDVPEKFVKTYEFNLADVKTLEIFSDGYHFAPATPTVEAFEEAFTTAEKEDPLRWKKYPAVKTSTPDQYSDDRTVLIAKK